MILPTFVLPSLSCQKFDINGMDSIDKCDDKLHFEKYPHYVTYRYNSRGYRDQEWPDAVSELEDSIWCIGDSFTVGLGSPREHTWPYILQQKLQKRTINISMDGASNQWICRKISELFAELCPKTILIHWSYAHRREQQLDKEFYDLKWKDFYKDIQGSTWPDCNSIDDVHKLPLLIQQEIIDMHIAAPAVVDLVSAWRNQCYAPDDNRRKIHFVNSSSAADFNDTKQCVCQVQRIAHKRNIRIVHSFVPDFASSSEQIQFLNDCKDLKTGFVPFFDRRDLARDGHHYDIITATALADQFIRQLIL